MSEAMVAGAIISGAYFGDKMSPLSDTTNLAPAMAGVDLFTHIRYMSYTTIPSICITLIILVFLGLNIDTQTSAGDISIIQNAINSKFNISIWLFTVPTIVIGLIIKNPIMVDLYQIGALPKNNFCISFNIIYKFI